MKRKTAQTPSSPTMKKSQTSDSTQSIESSDSSSNDSPSSKELQNSICRYLIENGHDFSVAASPGFKKMMSLWSGNVDCAIPTVNELKGSIFDDTVKEIDAYVSDIKSLWAETGCSVLLDEWTDSKGRSLMNVLVDCPKGAIYLNSYDVSVINGDINAIQNFFEGVLKEIGISNVVQVVANSLTDEFRMQLTDKFRSVFWTQSASCCMGLMLEKISAIEHIKETLDKADIIARFIYSYPYLFNYLSNKIDFRNFAKRFRIKSSMPFRRLETILLEKEFFTKWFHFFCSKIEVKVFKRVAELMADRSFWAGASTAVKAAMPLVRAMDSMDANEKAQIGYIYETIDRAKETIKEEFSNKKPDYIPYWDIINDVWSEQLRSPLHSAGYFLNPNLFYSSDSAIEREVATGLLSCVMRSSEDVRVLDKISLQLERYRNAKGCFFGGRNTHPTSILPVEWWSKYGKDCPELQRLAMRILSQTCDGASRFRLDRSLAETLATEGKERAPSEQKELRDMTHLRYNMMLQNYASGECSNSSDV